jgi:thymidylate synthase ThyX
MIDTKVVLATRPPEVDAYGLLTLELMVPSFVWTELLTHKRFARNASSARAQRTAKHVAMGYYRPTTFYRASKGMQAGEPVSVTTAAEAEAVWDEAWRVASVFAVALADMGVAKEQANRLLPPIKLIKGIVTGTEAAWGAFLALRNNPAADTAMQEFARQVKDRLNTVKWGRGRSHVPYGEGLRDLKAAAARIARVSYEGGKSVLADVALANRLIEDGHLSPFEHIAIWTENPTPSAICSRRDDYTVYGGTVVGWSNYRSYLEWKKAEAK